MDYEGYIAICPSKEFHIENFSVNSVTKLLETLDYILSFSNGEKYLLYYILRCKLTDLRHIFFRHLEIANNSTKAKNLLLMKKEIAIEELLTNLPFIRPDNHDVKMIYLKIMPVLFSHVSLYDVRIEEIFQIIDILKIHPAFIAQQSLLAQWYALFDARRLNKKRFSFKDENCVRDLPNLQYSFSDDSLTQSIGYSNISLLRAFHRWLRLHRLHKYLYFFASLSYDEILKLDESNFEAYQTQVNLHTITIGAKHKILREIDILRDRRQCLEEIMRMQFRSHMSIEYAVRDIKRILRTPICTKDIQDKNLVLLLLKVMKKVYDFVIDQAELNEKMIPIYGLLISICKEAWNYTIFKSNEKDLFNEWRQLLSEKAGQNCYVPSLSAARQVTMFVGELNFGQLSLQEQSAGNAYYQCLEDVATGCANFILNK